MNRRARRTLLFVAADRWIRVDVARDGRAAGGVAIDARIGIPLPAAVGELLAKGGPPASRIVIVAESLWTQTIELSSASAQGLAHADLARALAWELEPSSGIPATDATVSWIPLSDSTSGRKRIWALEMRASERDALIAIAAEHGARIERIAHPLGLVSEEGVVRVEVFEFATLVKTPNSFRVIAARPSQRSWEQALREDLSAVADGACVWRGRARAAHSAPRELAVTIEDRGPWDFERDGEKWLPHAVEQLLEREHELPALTPPTPVRAGILPILVGAVLALACLVWIFADRRGINERIAVRELEAQNADLSVEQARALEKENVVLRAKLAELTTSAESHRARGARIEPEWNAQRARIRALFVALGQERPGGLTVLRVQPTQQGALEIDGVGLDTAAIDRYVSELVPKLRDSNWDLLPARTGERTTDNGRRYFEFRLTVVPLTGVPRSADASSLTRARYDAHAVPAAAARPQRRND